MALPSTYQTEFPHFTMDVDVTPLTAAGFIDTSWHNDSCPSFAYYFNGVKDDSEAQVRVYIDYADPSERDVPDNDRFAVMRCDDTGEWIDAATGYTDWDEAVAEALRLVSKGIAPEENAAHFAVVGRLEGDYEDTCLMFQCADSVEARAAFIAEMCDREEGVEVFITTILRSEAPIENVT